MSTFYFNCNACGRCCNTPPAFLFSDFLDYSKEFLFSIKISSFKRVSNKTHIGYESLVKLNDNLYPIFNNNHVMCYPYAIKTGKKCTQLLDDGNCGIYEKRPERCKVVPFSMTIPEDIFDDKDLNIFLEQGCLTKENKPNFIKIYENNKISDMQFKNNLTKEIKNFSSMKLEVLKYLNYLKKHKTHIPKGTSLDISIVSYIEMLYDFKQITEEDALIFLKNQHTLFKKYVVECSIPYDQDFISTLMKINEDFALYKFNTKL